MSDVKVVDLSDEKIKQIMMVFTESELEAIAKYNSLVGLELKKLESSDLDVSRFSGFLCGANEYKGKWFGELDVFGHAFWWREDVRALEQKYLELELRYNGVLRILKRHGVLKDVEEDIGFNP